LRKDIANVSLGDQSNKEEPNAARKVEKIEETISNASLQNGIAINNNHLSLMIEGKIAEKTRMCQKLAEKMAKKGLLKCDDSEISLQFSSGMSIIDAHKKALYEATERKSKELMTMSKEAILKLDKETDAVIIKSAKKSNYLTRTPMSDIQTKSEETDVDVLGKQLKKRLVKF